MNRLRTALCISLIALSSTLLVACGDEDATSSSDKNSGQTTESSVMEENGTEGSKGLYEDASNSYNTDAEYKNDEVLTYDYGDGTITIGTKSAPDNKHIYLDIRCSEAADGNEIGYYVESDRVDVQVSPGGGMGCDAGNNASENNFVLLDRLYDNVTPSTVRDSENYGVRWCDDKMKDGENDGTTIAIRAINLRSGAIVAMCDAVIDYDKETNSYSLSKLASSDVKYNSELDDTSRTNIINKAAEFAAERLHNDASDYATDKAIVDKHNGTYFSRFLDEDDSILYYKDYTTCRDTYTVTLPSASYGFITVYFAPQTQLIGMTSPTEPGKKI